MVVVLGIDPGTAHTGYGVVVAHGRELAALDGGVLHTDATDTQEQRLAQIHSHVESLINRHQPEAMAVEDLFFGHNAQSAFAVGQARGVMLLAAGQAGIPCFSYTPQAIKKAVCGSGRAEKEQIQRMVSALLKLPAAPRQDHAADALAVAICHANSAVLRQVLA